MYVCVCCQKLGAAEGKGSVDFVCLNQISQHNLCLLLTDTILFPVI